MNSSKKIMNQNKKAETKSSVSAPASNKKLGANGENLNKKAIILGIISIVIILGICIGVGVQQIKPQVVLKVNDTKLTMDDMMYPIYERESQYLSMDEMYQAYFGTSVWEASYMGTDSTVDSSMTNSVGLKQEIVNAETEYQVLYDEAVKADYKLTDDEKKQAVKQAEDALKGLSWLQKFQLAISKNKLTERFEKRILADRYKEDQQTELNKKVDEKEAIKDISKKDLRQYDIQFYYADTNVTNEQGNEVTLSSEEKKNLEKQIRDLAKKAEKAKDFTKLLGDDEEESELTYETAEFTETDGWSEYLSDKYVAQIKKMKNGEISPVFVDETTGYYMFVKMINNNSSESYKAACESAVESEQETLYQEWLDGIEKGYKIKLYNEIWGDVTIGTVTTDIVTAEDLADMQEDSSEATSESE